MTTPHAHQELTGTLLATLTRELRTRVPRAEAEHEIEVHPVPMRTCYETMTRLVGPCTSVLDYAAYLFAADANARTEPTPPLAIEEAQLDTETGEMSLVLTRGTFTVR